MELFLLHQKQRPIRAINDFLRYDLESLGKFVLKTAQFVFGENVFPRREEHIYFFVAFGYEFYDRPTSQPAEEIGNHAERHILRNR